MKHKTIKECIEDLLRLQYTTENGESIKDDKAFAELEKLADRNYLLIEHQRGDCIWAMIDNKPTEVIVTSIKVLYGTTSEGIYYTTKKAHYNVTWFDGGEHKADKVFKTKEELLKSL